MGYDQDQQSSSSGVLVAVVVAVLLVVVLGMLLIAGVGMYWLRGTSQMQARAVVAERRAMEELQRAESVAAERRAMDGLQRAEAMAQQQAVQVAATPDPRQKMEVAVDREGSATVDGKVIDLTALRNRLLELKNETANVFTVQIVADPDCPAGHLVTILNACHEVGDIGYRVSVRKAEETPGEPGA